MQDVVTSVDLVYPVVPPAQDAIGEYTALLAEELSKLARVRILTSDSFSFTPISNVEVVKCFREVGRSRYTGLLNELRRSRADATVLQYNPFSWGARGWAPDLVKLWRRMTREFPHRHWTTMFHETYMLNPGWRAAVMRCYQQWQFRTLAKNSTINFFSTEAWMTPRFIPRGLSEKCIHLPVGSNMPSTFADHDFCRRHFGISDNTFVIGFFGGSHVSKRINWVVAAANKIADVLKERPIVFLHVGEHISWPPMALRILEVGRLPPMEASSAISCMDLLLSPFTDGLTTRRGSVMAALALGVPVVSTETDNTDKCLQDQSSSGLFLTRPTFQDWLNDVPEYAKSVLQDRQLYRRRLVKYYDREFCWRSVAEKLIVGLTAKRKSGTQVEFPRI